MFIGGVLLIGPTILLSRNGTTVIAVTVGKDSSVIYVSDLPITYVVVNSLFDKSQIAKRRIL